MGGLVLWPSPRDCPAFSARAGRAESKRLNLARVLSFALAAAALVTAALAQPVHSLSGAWSGQYTCPQGVTAMRLDLREGKAGAVEGVMTFYAHPDNPTVPSGCFTMHGKFNAATGKLQLRQGHWISRPDAGWYMIDLDGKIDQHGYKGAVGFPISPGACTTFAVEPVQQSAPRPRTACDSALIS